jgi:hypothetical protein
VLFASCAPAPSTCVPGQTVSCPCPGSGTGAQTCTERGTFAPCVCTGADAGVDVAMDIASEPFPDVVCDRDLDGFRSRECGGDDCNDSDPAVHPRALTRCVFEDSDCNGTPDWMASRSTLDAWCVSTAPGPDALAAGPWCATPLISTGPYTVRNDALCAACRVDSSAPGGAFCVCWRGLGESWACNMPPARDR